VKGFEQAVQSSARVAAIQGIDVYLPNHGWNPGTDYPNGSLFERFPKLLARKPANPTPSSIRLLETEHRSVAGTDKARPGSGTEKGGRPVRNRNKLRV